MTSFVKQVRRQVEVDFASADSAHDIGHLDRVAALAGAIAVQLGADPAIAQVAAYVHDYHRLEEARQNHSSIRPEEVGGTITKVLEGCEVPAEDHSVILEAVGATDSFTFGGDEVSATNVIVAAVHDADSLDAMGALGIGRAFAFGGRIGEPLWHPRATLQDLYREGPTSSILAHLYEKLVRLEGDMLTAPARTLATERTMQLHSFAAGFRRQWDCMDAVKRSEGCDVTWDAVSGYLSIETPVETQVAAIHVAFRGQVELSFDHLDQPSAITMLDAPAAVTCYVPAALPPRVSNAAGVSVWLLDADTRDVWVRVSHEAPTRNVRAIADVDVVLRGDLPASVAFHILKPERALCEDSP